MNAGYVRFLAIAGLIAAPLQAPAGDDGYRVNHRRAGEVNLLGTYSRTDDWGAALPPLPRTGVGAEYFASLAGRRGDFLTVDLQARIAYDARDDTDSTWALELHNAWARWRPGLGRHLRVGHFPPAYGLEPVTDTHGTLLQTLAMQDIGFKHDWGLGYEGLIGPLDYRLAAQLGSGMGIRHEDGSYLLTARIATPESEQVRWGLSLLQGQVLPGSDRRLVPTPRYTADSVRKTRIGADVRLPLGPFSTAAELSLGKNESDEVLGGIAEVRKEFLAGTPASLALQGRYWSDRPGTSSRTRLQAAAVLAYPLSPAATLRIAFFEDVSVLDDVPRERTGALQFYYLGP
jgi:hypothetical protein